MKFQIRNRWTNAVQVEVEIDARFENEPYSIQLGAAVKAAYKAKANLRDANLRAADLSDADLRDANLSAADLSAADLRDANLRDANLRAADLSAADLSGADLSAANLRAADLRAANLSAADLRVIRDDVWAVLSAAPAEVAGLRAALAEGRVDGSTYEGECACLVGTIANVRHANYQRLGILKPDSSRPAERFFFNINKGDTPETNQSSKIALEWVDEWLGAMTAVFGTKP